MECPICFNDARKFKILECAHFFCVSCCSSLIKGKGRIEALNGRSSLKASPEGSLEAPTTHSMPDPSARAPSITCPKCRSLTLVQGGVDGLRTKWLGSLSCRDCDEEKGVVEFRWCQTCLASICSACYVDKHSQAQPDGSRGLHVATKWDDYAAVKFLLSQLKLDVAQSQQSLDSAQQYLASYLHGLHEFLTHEQRQRSSQFTKDVEEAGKVLAAEFGFNWDEMPTADVASKAAAYVLPNIRRLTGLEDQVRAVEESRGGMDVSVAPVPYPELARFLLGTGTAGGLPTSLHMDPARFSARARESFLIGGDMLRCPAHFAQVADKVFAITDVDGIYLYNTEKVTLTGPIKLNQVYAQYSHVAQIPTETYTPPENSSTFIVNVRYQQSAWSSLLVTLPVFGKPRHVKMAEHRNHWHLPKNEDMSLCASTRAVFGASSTNLYRLAVKQEKDAVKPDWTTLYSFPGGGQPPRIGPVIDKSMCTEILVMNTAWGCVDMVSVGVGADAKLWGVRRVELPASVLPSPCAEPCLAFWASSVESRELLVGSGGGRSIVRWGLGVDGGSEVLHTWRRKFPVEILVSHGKTPTAYLLMEATSDEGSPHMRRSFEIVNF